MQAQDEQFWDRLSGMPAWEAEQECVMRRERLTAEVAALTAARASMEKSRERGWRDAFAESGVEMARINAALSRLNDRIKYLRKLQDRIHWRAAVRELFGGEAVEQCVVHMELRHAELYDKRREWCAGKPPV